MTGVPRRAGCDHVRGADAATDNGAAFLALDWLNATGRTDSALAAWARGSLAEVPVGLAWDVVRVPALYGPETVQELRTAAVPLGPVLSSPSGTEFLVELGAADSWSVLGTEAASSGSLLLCPHPSIIEPWSIHRRCWLVTPSDVLTRRGDLLTAYTAASALVAAREAVTP